MSLYIYVNTMEIQTRRKIFSLFWPHWVLLAFADSVQSPIVSFTQYCLLASPPHNLLKEERNIKQIRDKKRDFYFFADRKSFFKLSVLFPVCAMCKPLNSTSNLVLVRCQYLLKVINCSCRVQKKKNNFTNLCLTNKLKRLI